MKRCFQIKAPTTTSTATVPLITPPTITPVSPAGADAFLNEDGTRDVEFDELFEWVCEGIPERDEVRINVEGDVILSDLELVNEVVDNDEDRVLDS